MKTTQTERQKDRRTVSHDGGSCTDVAQHCQDDLRLPASQIVWLLYAAQGGHMDRLPSAPDVQQAIVTEQQVWREWVRLTGKALLDFFLLPF